jgi:hypothetical protein
VTERRPPDEPAQENDQDESELDRFEALTKRRLEAEPVPDGPPEIEDAARQDVEYPADETDEG